MKGWHTRPQVDGEGLFCGIEFGRDPAIFVINMTVQYDAGWQWENLTTTIAAAYNEGLLLVASAGNVPGGAVLYPANLPEVVAVGATTPGDSLWWQSAVGPEIELVAPGVNIYTTSIPNPSYCDAAPNPDYAYCDGTSYAAPHVAAVAALINATNPSLSNVEVRQLLRDTAEPLGWPIPNNQFGWGLVDAAKAVAFARPFEVTADVPQVVYTEGTYQLLGSASEGAL